MERASGQVLHIVPVQARHQGQRECTRVEVVAYLGVPRCRSFHHLVVVMEGTWGQVLSMSCEHVVAVSEKRTHGGSMYLPCCARASLRLVAVVEKQHGLVLSASQRLCAHVALVSQPAGMRA
jgi:hypothetical protein